MPPGFRTINNPYLTPLGAQLVITGIPQFNAAALNVQRQFTQIGQAAVAVATQITALNSSLAAFSIHARALQTIGSRAQNISAIGAGARGIPRRGGSGGGVNPLAALGTIEPAGQARAFFGQRAGPLSIYTRLPITLNATAVAAVAAGVAIIGMGAKLQQTSRQVQVFGSTTEQQMNAIREAAIGMSREFTSGANEIAQGAVQLAKAGAPIDDLNNNILRSVTVLNQASQGEVSMADASDTLVQGITALNLKWSESPRFIGGLVTAVNSSTASFSDFTLQLKQVLPVAGLLKFNYDELFASLALLNQAGLRGSIAGTALKNAIIAIADPTTEAGEILRKYNISLFDAEGKALPLIEVLGRLVDAFGKTNEGVTDAQKFFETTDIFNTRQILAALSIINQGNDKYAEFLATIRGGLDTGEQVAKNLQNNLIDQLRLVFNTTVAAAHAITGEFLPSLTGIASRLRESMAADNLQGYRDFGKTVNELITFNNNFANSLIREVAPGVLLLGESLNTVTASLNPLGIGADSVGGAILRLAALLSAVSGIIARDIATWPATFKQLEDAGIRLAVMFQGIRRLIADPTAYQQLNAELNAASQQSLAQGHTFQEAAMAQLAVFRAFFNNEAVILIQGIAATGKSATQVAAEGALGITGLTVDAIINLMNQADAAHAAALERMRARAAAFIISQNPPISRERQLFNEANRDLGIGGVAATIPAGNFGGGGSSFPPSKPDGGGGSAGDELKKIAAQVRAALSGIPALTEDLVDFIANIAQDTPARLQPMLTAINSSASIIADLVIAKRDLLKTDLQLIGIERRLTELNAQSAQLDIERAIAVIGFDKQLIGINQQLLVIDQQRQPIEDAMRLVDREIARLGQENLATKRALLELELQQLPARQRIEDIEREIEKHNRTNFELERQKLQLSLASISIRHQLADLEEQIAALGRTNFDLVRAQLRDELAALPIRKQIRDIENQITDAVDRRAAIQSQLAELDLADIEDELAKAWESNDVDTIIRLEEEKALIEERLKSDEKADRAAKRVQLGLQLTQVALEDQLKPIERRLQLLQDTQDKQRLMDDMTRTFLDEEKRRLEDLLKPYNDRLKIIERQTEIEGIRSALAVLALEQEKRAIMDQLDPLEQKRQAIERELALENLRNQILITHLDEEKRRLEAQLVPLEDQRRAIERIKQEVEFLRASAQVEFDERSIHIKQMVLQEQLRQAELEATRREQELLFGKIILGFADSLVASEAFTGGEALEVAQRLKLWDDSIAKLAETIIEFQRLSIAAGDAAKRIKEIERDITVTITTVHRTVYESAGTPPATTADPGVQQFAGGGIVPGRRGEPMLIMAHGGERIISVTNASVPSHISAKQAGSVTNISNHYETNYNVNPSYSSYQSPAALTDDLRALIVASSRG